MANVTTLERMGTGESIPMDSEVTQNGEYPVKSSGIYAAIQSVAVDNATVETAGKVKMAENVAEAEGDNPTAAEFKALLDALISAGLMAEAEPEP